jgi:hypothetical protein
MTKTATPNTRCCIFIPSWGNNRAISQLYYTKFLKNLKAFDEVHCLFYPNQGINHSVPQISNMAAQYIDAERLYDKHGSLTIIGYRMGGLIALDLLEWNKKIAQNTHAVVSIASPVNGRSRYKKLFKLSTIFSRATYDTLSGSVFLKRLHKNLKKLEEIPHLSIAAGWDRTIFPKNALLANTDQTIIEKTFNINILQKTQTQTEINSWFTNKVLNKNWLDQELFPSIRFVDLSEERG